MNIHSWLYPMAIGVGLWVCALLLFIGEFRKNGKNIPIPDQAPIVIFTTGGAGLIALAILIGGSMK